MNVTRALRAGIGALLLFATAAFAQLAVPPVARVSDQTATLTGADIQALDRTLQDFELRKGSQIAVLIVPTTAPETVEQYAVRVAETWKLGRKGVDDGVLLLVAKDDHALRIEVGYGLEGALTDIASKRIVSDVIVPHFRQGDFAAGIRAGVDRIMRTLDGEPLPAPAARAVSGDGYDALGSYAPVLFIVMLGLGSVLRAMLGRTVGAFATGGVVGFIAWVIVGLLPIAIVAGVIALFITLFGGGRGGGFGGGGWGGGYGGGGGWGGGSGGGFSGGGGGFGGGGASGRW